MLEFNEDAELRLTGVTQLENVGFDSHNSVLNLNTVSIVIVFLCLRIAIGLMFLIIERTCCRSSEGTRNCRKRLLDNVFMNIILELGLEVLMDFIITIYLNAQAQIPGALKSGEILGYFLTAFASFMCFVVLPCCLVWYVVRRPSKEEIASEEFTGKWSILSEELRTDTRWHLAFYLVFYVRRMIYLAIGLGLIATDYFTI